MKEVCSTCPYCGVGCGVVGRVEQEQLICVEGNKDHPANLGKLCVKGSNLHTTSLSQGRLLHPMVNGEQVSWDSALTHTATTLKNIIEQHGPDAIAFYLSGQLLTEDYYVANKLMKGFIGSANVDTNSRLCMASAVAAQKRAFGEDVVPCNYTDLEQCDLLVMVGSNTAWTHPVVYQRIAQAKADGDMRVLVIDPRRTSTCDIADLHLRIAPGSDGALFNGLMTYLTQTKQIDQGFIDLHTDGFAQATQSNAMSSVDAATCTGLDEQQLLDFYLQFANAERVVTLYSQGINQSQSGTDKANAIINCHLATGQIGKPGCGPFSITGQPNAMGGREVGGMANQLAAHMGFTDSDIETISSFWRAPHIARAPGLKAIDMFDALDRGEIKAIWIMGTNPAVSLPNSTKVRAALARCPNVIISDTVADTDTTQFANVLLPAQAWGEKDGTVTNSERVISRQRRLVQPVGEARPDWQILCDVAAKLGYQAAFNYAKPRDVFLEHAALSAYRNEGSRLFNLSDLAGLTVSEYEQLQPTQWPRQKRPFADGVFTTETGNAQFVPTPHRAPQQLPTKRAPFVLNTGRLRDQWHTMTKTGTSSKLWQHQPQPLLQIHPADAQRIGLQHGQLAELSNDLGKVVMLTEVTQDTPPGSLFAPIHWSDQFANRAGVSHLVHEAVDPISGQPESKHATVACQPIQSKCWAKMVLGSTQHIKAINNLPDLLYWSLSVDKVGNAYEMAFGSDVDPLIELGIDVSASYVAPNGIHRYAGTFNGHPVLLYLARQRADLPSTTFMAKQITEQAQPWLQLSTSAAASEATAKLICSCFEVSETQIVEAIEQGCNSVALLGKTLRCGTNCGSCVPELNRLTKEIKMLPIPKEANG